MPKAEYGFDALTDGVSCVAGYLVKASKLPTRFAAFDKLADMKRGESVHSHNERETSAHVRSMRARRFLTGAVALLLLLAMLLLCSGCKYSDVLTQHIEDPDIGVLDENAEPIYKSNPNAPKRPDLVDVTVDESEDENEQEEALPEYDPEGMADVQTNQREYSDKTPHDQNATEGEASNEDPDRAGSGEDEDAEDDGKEEEEDEGLGDGEEKDDSEEGDVGDEEGDGEDLESDEEDDPESSDEGSANNDTEIVSEDGTKDEVATGTVAAVGEYATIAQMLGGAGALAACDQAWLDARTADGAFAGELSRVEIAFSGDEESGYTCDVDMLVNTVKPSVVLWDSTGNAPSLSDTERSALEAAGIKVQAVPHLGEQTTEDSVVKTAVQEVAAVLAGADGIALDPTSVCSEYLKFHDGVLTDCYNSNDGYSYKVTEQQYIGLYQNTPLSGLGNSTTTRVATVFVEDVMSPSVSSAAVEQNATTSEGTMRLAHDGEELDLSDGVALSATTSTGGYMLMDYYLQLAGVMNNSYDGEKAEGKPYIIAPGTIPALGNSGNFAKRSTASALFYNSGDGSVAANWHVLGDSDFPAVLASTTEVADALVASASKDDGLYRMESPYQVIVVPKGLAGPWSEGHLDSFLMAPWAFRIADAANLTAAAGYAQDFYSTFMRCANWDSAISDWDSAYTAG